MKRIVLAVVTTLAALLLPLVGAGSASAAATCTPDGVCDASTPNLSIQSYVQCASNGTWAANWVITNQEAQAGALTGTGTVLDTSYSAKPTGGAAFGTGNHPMTTRDVPFPGTSGTFRWADGTTQAVTLPDAFLPFGYCGFSQDTIVTGPSTFTLNPTTTILWHDNTCPDGSCVNYYTVQVQREAWNAKTFSAWSTPSGWGTIPSTTTRLMVPLTAGYETCIRVRSTYPTAQTSPWSTPRCTSRPLDDRLFTRSAGWTLGSGSGYYLGTYTATKTYGATLTRSGVTFDQLALVATKCSTCGVVWIYSGSTVIGKVNLYRSTTARHLVIVLPKVSLRTATIKIRVMSSNKTIQIDGLGVTRDDSQGNNV